jgi:hypothetical protein
MAADRYHLSRDNLPTLTTSRLTRTDKMDGRRSRKTSLHQELPPPRRRRPKKTKSKGTAASVSSADNSPQEKTAPSSDQSPHPEKNLQPPLEQNPSFSSHDSPSNSAPPQTLAKGKWTRKMTIDRIPAGHFAIGCPEPNCNQCRTFTPETILRLRNKANPKQVVPTVDTIKWETMNKQHQMVDLHWDEVPAVFRTISAFIKMKEHLRDDHSYGPMQEGKGKYPPLFSSLTLEQKRQQKARERKVRNKNNSSGVDIPTP